jgi:hypothetical protein
MALKRDQIKPPALPREAVMVEELGGEVIVRGLLLRERLALFAGASEGAAEYKHVCEVLAVSVLAGDDKPVYTADEWEAFGARHLAAAISLFSHVQRLSGLDIEASKKS